MTLRHTVLLSLFIAGSLPQIAAAENIDSIVFGSKDSEIEHRFSDVRSERCIAALGQTARHLLPLDPVSYNGGWVKFRLRVDPERQNYFTVKLWGGDRGAQSGRLILYINGLQVGYLTRVTSMF